MTKKELFEQLENIEDWLNNYKIGTEEAYCDLRNTATDYDYDLEDLFYDYLTNDEADDYVIEQAKMGGLARVYYFLWNVNPMACDLFKLDWYGNLEEVHNSDLIELIDEIRDRIGEDEEDEEEETEDK